MTTETYVILTEKQEKVEKTLRRYEKKAKKYGIPFSYSFGEPYCITRSYKNDYGYVVENKYEVVDLTIESEIIRKDGYEIIARLEHSNTGNIVNVFIGEMKAEWATIPPHCDHCNGNHGQKVTFIVRKGEEEKQVGRTCLKEYCGIDPQAIGIFNSFSEEIDDCTADGCEFGEGFPCVYDTVEMLAFAIEVYKEQGYIKSDEFKSNKSEISKACGTRHPSEEAMKEAQKLADAIAEMSVEDAVEIYLNNVQVRIKGYYCKPSDFGYIAYAPVAYERWLKKQEAKKQREAKNADLANGSKYVGTIGERTEFHVKEAVLLTSYFTDYGMTHLYRFIDENGNVLIWFASSCIETDGVKCIKATVKAHNERDGVKQTIITRVKVV